MAKCLYVTKINKLIKHLKQSIFINLVGTTSSLSVQFNVQRSLYKYGPKY